MGEQMKYSTDQLVTAQSLLCTCGECVGCRLARRAENQVLEINNMHKSVETYVHMTVWRGQIISGAIKYLKENRPVNALAVLTDRVDDGDKILRELAK